MNDDVNAMTVIRAVFCAGLVGVMGGCGKGWEMDYGKPAAQFLEKDLAAKGGGFVGEKITVKGTVTKVDLTVPDAAVVVLDHGIRCQFGKMSAMAGSCKVGDTVFVDGFLKQCKPGDILIDPATLRDPTASFSPVH